MPATDSEPVRVGLIGCGRHASQCIHPSLPYVPELEVVAVCDLDESLARATARRLGTSAVYTALESMLAEEQPEATIVIGPGGMHAEVGLACLEAGCHLFVDKPPALNPKDAHRLADTAARRSLIGQVGHNQRYSPAIRTAKHITASAEFGEPTTVITKYGGWIPDEPRWGLSPLLGGMLYFHSIHAVDTARNFMGDIQSVSAYQVSGIDVQGGGPIAVILEFVSGGLGFLDLNTATPYYQMRTIVAGSAATIVEVLDLNSVEYLERPEAAEQRGVAPAEPELAGFHKLVPRSSWTVPRYYPMEKAFGYVDELAAFARAVRSGEPSQPTLGDGYENLLGVEAIARSLETGAAVTIQEMRAELG